MADSDDYEETFFIKYRDCVNVIGKRVLLKLLKWFYKGGETSYVDYLSSEYDMSSLSHLIDTSYMNDLKYKEPEYFQMTLIHSLLQLTCNLYEEKEQANKKDKRYKILERNINKLVLMSETLLSMNPILNEIDLLERIEKLGQMLMEMTETGCSLSGADIVEQNNLLREISIDTMKIYHRTKDHWYLDDKCASRSQKYDFSNVKHKALPNSNVKHKALPNCNVKHKTLPNNIKNKCRAILANSDNMSIEECKGKLGDMIASHNKNILKQLRQEEALSFLKVSEHINTTVSFSSQAVVGAGKESRKISKSKKDPSSISQEKPVSRPSTEAEKPVSGSSALTEKPPSHKKSGPTGQKTPSPSGTICETEEIRNIFGSVQSVKNKNTASVSDNCTAKDIKLIQSKIRAALGSGKYRKQKPERLSPLSLHAYTDIMLNQHQRYSCKPGHQVRLRDVFNVEGMNEGFAEIILISGEAGMGKTWLMKYIEEKWRCDQTAVDKLASRDLLIPFELQKNRCSSFTQLASNLLKDKIGDIGVEDTLEEAVLGLPLLVTLDGYDESCENSCKLVEEVLKMSGKDLRVIITSRPQYVDFIYEQVPSHRRKHVAHLCLNGIAPPHHANFVARIIDSSHCGRKDSAKWEKTKEGLKNRLPDIYETIGEDLCNPLMLKIISAMWMEHPHEDLNVEEKLLVV